MTIFANEVMAASTADAFGRAIDPIIQHIVNPLVMLLFAVALVVFVFGLVEMLSHGDDADARGKGKRHMMGGVIGMFIMLSAWGIVNLIANTLWEFEDNGVVNDSLDAGQDWNRGNFEGQV